MNTPAIMISAAKSPAHGGEVPAIEGPERGTMEVRVICQQYDYVDAVFKNPANRSPRFAFCDLVSACVALVLAGPDAETRIYQVLHRELVLLSPKTRRRNVHVWIPQIIALRCLQNSALNRHPNPTFDLDQLVTACITIVDKEGIPFTSLFDQARRNTASRAQI